MITLRLKMRKASKQYNKLNVAHDVIGKETIKDNVLKEDWASTSGALPFGKCTAILG